MSVRAFSLFLFILISLPSVAQNANGDGAANWPGGVCGTEEEFVTKLNHLNDTVICHNAMSLAACSVAIGGAGLGSIAAMRAARVSAGLSAKRETVCRIAMSDFLSWLINKATAKPSCQPLGRIAVAQSKEYLKATKNGLTVAANREKAALASLFGSERAPTAVDVYTRPPTSPTEYQAYLNGMIDELSDESNNFSPMPNEYRMASIEQLRTKLADVATNPQNYRTPSQLENAKASVRAKVGSVGFKLEKKLAAQVAAASAPNPWLQIKTILDSTGAPSAPGVLSRESEQRLTQFRTENPALVDDLTKALESRRIRNMATTGLQQYSNAILDVTSFKGSEGYAANPHRLQALVEGLPHFDLPDVNNPGKLIVGDHQRFLVTAAINNALPPKTSRMSSYALKVSATKRAVVGAGSGLARKAASALAVGGVVAGGTVGSTVAAGAATVASVAEVIDGSTQMGCGERMSQFRNTDEKGCGNIADILNPKTQKYLTLPAEFQMAEAADDTNMCVMVNELFDKYYGPNHLRASCNGDSGFTLESKDIDEVYDFKFGASPGNVSQMTVSGDGSFQRGGEMAMIFNNNELSEVRVPGDPSLWRESMITDEEATRNFSVPETYHSIAATSLRGPDASVSANQNNALSRLNVFSLQLASIAEVHSCCTGIGYPGAELCNKYGIKDSPLKNANGDRSTY